MADAPSPSPSAPSQESTRRLFRRTLVFVIAVELATLLLLWLLQARYSL